MDYLITKWALTRQNELVALPCNFDIHPDYLHNLSREEFQSAFCLIHKIFYEVYSDMATNPQLFGFPLYNNNELEYFSKEAREIRTLPWTPFIMLMYMFTHGNWHNNVYYINIAEVCKEKKIKNTNLFLRVFEKYGFVFDGIKNYRLSSASQLIINYPDNKNVIYLLDLAAKKVMYSQLKDDKNFLSCKSAYKNAFIAWNSKLFSEPIDVCSVGNGCDYVADKMHSDMDKKFVYEMDRILTQTGYICNQGDPNEGPSIRYSRAKTVFDFALSSNHGILVLELRIRNAEKCLNYLCGCSNEIIQMFRYTDQGCQNRINGTCRHGVKYIFENEEKWHCGCCGAPFKIHPTISDMQHYINLVKLGNKK